MSARRAAGAAARGAAIAVLALAPWALGCGADDTAGGEAAPAVSQERPVVDRKPAGRPAARPDRRWLAAARERMRRPVEGSCGPYRLLTDSGDHGLLELCERIGGDLDAVYAARFGLEPVGPPDGAILLFGRREDYRRFAGEVAGLAAGHAGFSRAARGLVALPEDAELFATTLAHELTHLVHRRALGPELAPWLSEGLADAIGDAAGAAGLGELVGLRGVEPQARRLAAAIAGEDPPRLARLAARRRDEFDRGVPSFDYEHSALAARMLLTDPELAPGFRRFLSLLAAGEPYSPRLLPRILGIGWSELDRRLAAWLASGLSSL